MVRVRLVRITLEYGVLVELEYNKFGLVRVRFVWVTLEYTVLIKLENITFGFR